MISPNEILFLHIVKGMDAEEIAVKFRTTIAEAEFAINTAGDLTKEKFLRWKNIKSREPEARPDIKIDEDLFGDGYSSFPERLLEAGVNMRRVELSNQNYRDAACMS